MSLSSVMLECNKKLPSFCVDFEFVNLCQTSRYFTQFTPKYAQSRRYDIMGACPNLLRIDICTFLSRPSIASINQVSPLYNRVGSDLCHMYLSRLEQGLRIIAKNAEDLNLSQLHSLLTEPDDEGRTLFQIFDDIHNVPVEISGQNKRRRVHLTLFNGPALHVSMDKHEEINSKVIDFLMHRFSVNPNIDLPILNDQFFAAANVAELSIDTSKLLCDFCYQTYHLYDVLSILRDQSRVDLQSIRYKFTEGWFKIGEIHTGLRVISALSNSNLDFFLMLKSKFIELINNGHINRAAHISRFILSNHHDAEDFERDLIDAIKKLVNENQLSGLEILLSSLKSSGNQRIISRAYAAVGIRYIRNVNDLPRVSELFSELSEDDSRTRIANVLMRECLKLRNDPQRQEDANEAEEMLFRFLES